MPVIVAISGVADASSSAAAQRGSAARPAGATADRPSGLRCERRRCSAGVSSSSAPPGRGSPAALDDARRTRPRSSGQKRSASVVVDEREVALGHDRRSILNSAISSVDHATGRTASAPTSRAGARGRPPSSAVPAPYHDGSRIRFCVHANTHGIARSVLEPAAARVRDAGREPIVQLGQLVDRRDLVEEAHELRVVVDEVAVARRASGRPARSISARHSAGTAMRGARGRAGAPRAVCSSERPASSGIGVAWPRSPRPAR